MAAMALWSYSCRSRIIMAEDKTKIATLPGTRMLMILRFCETEAARREGWIHRHEICSGRFKLLVQPLMEVPR